MNNKTQENKKLLLQDLCARLPYGVKITDGLNVIKTDPFISIGVFVYDGKWKPYLRPMSSMTEKERKEYKHLVAFSGSPDGATNFTDWLNAHHFDHRGLIEKGLAIEVTEKNNPYK